MNKPAKMSLLVCSLIFAAIAIAILVGGGGDAGAFVGLGALIFSALYLFIGIILVLLPDTRDAGKGMLLTSGILLLVGFAVCSVALQ